MIRILEPINHIGLLKEYLTIKSGIVWNQSVKSMQSGLQYLEGEDQWLSATGKSRGRELEYTNLNPYFVGTKFEQLIEKYELKRTRLMWLNANSCYSMHKDTTPRIHIPLITNKQCFMVFKDGLVEHMPGGNVYWADTRLDHTAMNGSDLPRLHLVGVVDS